MLILCRLLVVDVEKEFKQSPTIDFDKESTTTTKPHLFSIVEVELPKVRDVLSLPAKIMGALS